MPTSDSLPWNQKATVVNSVIDALLWDNPILNPVCGQLEPPLEYRIAGCMAYADGTNWNPGYGAGIYLYDGATWVKMGTSPKAMFTVEGGFAVKLTNKTGGASVKGEVVTPSDATNNAVIKIVKDVPNPIGVFYESGVADAAEAWIVVSGIADVYFVGNTTRGHLARGFLTADGGSYVTGQAMSEALPTSPFSSDKHFYEIGHVLEARTGAGLAKVVLHFN
jgi:hypothetical protein